MNNASRPSKKPGTAKAILQEMVKSHSIMWTFEGMVGPSHSPKFDYSCRALGAYGRASAPTKRSAMQKSAHSLLAELAQWGYDVPAPYRDPPTTDVFLQQETPQQDTPQRETPQQETLQQETPQRATPQQEVLQVETRQQFVEPTLGTAEGQAARALLSEQERESGLQPLYDSDDEYMMSHYSYDETDEEVEELLGAMFQDLDLEPPTWEKLDDYEDIQKN